MEFCERTTIRDDLAILPDRNSAAAKRFECWVHGVRVAAGSRTSLLDPPVKRPGDGSFGWCCQSLDGGGGIRLTGFG